MSQLHASEKPSGSGLVSDVAAALTGRPSVHSDPVSAKGQDLINAASTSGPRVILVAGRDALIACASFVAVVATSIGSGISKGFSALADFVSEKKAAASDTASEKVASAKQTLVSAFRSAAASAARFGAGIFSAMSIAGSNVSAKVRSFMSTNGNQSLPGRMANAAQNPAGPFSGNQGEDGDRSQAHLTRLGHSGINDVTGAAAAATPADALPGARQRPLGVAATDVAADLTAKATGKPVRLGVGDTAVPHSGIAAK